MLLALYHTEVTRCAAFLLPPVPTDLFHSKEMEDELAAEMTCVALTALLAFIVTVPFLVAYCVSTSEEWFCDSRARPARQQARDESTRPAPRPPKRLAHESTRRDISTAKKEDSRPRTADSARPARQQARNESPRPAPRPLGRLAMTLARESTRRDISTAKKEDSCPRTASRCSASVQTASSRTPANPASSKRVQLDVRHVAHQAPRKRVFEFSCEGVEAVVEMESFGKEQSIELSGRHMALASSKSTLDREVDHFPVTPPSTTPERGQDPSHNMSNRQKRGEQSSSDAMEPSSTATSSSRRSGSTSSDIQTLQASSGAVDARRVRGYRRAFSYTRRANLYTLPEEDPG